MSDLIYVHFDMFDTYLIRITYLGITLCLNTAECDQKAYNTASKNPTPKAPSVPPLVTYDNGMCMCIEPTKQK